MGVSAGQLYSNTSYPNGYNFNLRPWVTGHTYQNYGYDPLTRQMVFGFLDGRTTLTRTIHFWAIDRTEAEARRHDLQQLLLTP